MSRIFNTDLADRLEQFHIDEDGEDALDPFELYTILEMSPTIVEAVYNGYKLGILKGARRNASTDT